MYYIYLPIGLSGVTKLYVEIICESIEKAGFGYKHVASLKDIPKGSNIVTISDKDSTYASIICKPKRLITWFQGISPEEMNMIYAGKLERWPRYKINRLFERYALRKGSLNLFVSKTMKHHYQQHYGNIGKSNMIMPCFGNSIDPAVFTDSRYEKPRFLYYGSMFTWQCVDKMLLLFKKNKRTNPRCHTQHPDQRTRKSTAYSF